MTANGTNGLARAAAAGADLSRELDELLRRRLGVSDVRDAERVAEGLRKLYANAATRIDQESQGFAIGGESNPIVAAPTASASDTPGSREYRRVRDALVEDLDALVNAPSNREWKPELQGWRSTMLRTFAEGAIAARAARDPARRDMAFLAVRTLGEYARVARLVGVVHLRMNFEYRRFAKTLDEAASTIRVLAGEALYDAGLADGGLIVAVPVTDIRQRGDAVVAALRGLLGLDASGPDDTGENLHGYNMLLRNLEAWGEGDLGSYLREVTLQQAIDDMVESVSLAVGRNDADALRELAATLPVQMRKFRRLADVANNVVNPSAVPPSSATALGGSADQAASTGVAQASSPALSRFVQALELLLQSVERPRRGARLIDLAVPLPIAALQTDEEDGQVRTRLRDLVNRRAEFAREADEYLSYVGATFDDLRTQVRIDMVLQHLDRAIDLIATGGSALDGEGGDPNARRAAIVGILVVNLREQKEGGTPYQGSSVSPPPPPYGTRFEDSQSADGWGPSPFPALLNDLTALLFFFEPRLGSRARIPSGDGPANWLGSGTSSGRTMPPSLDPLVRSEMDKAQRDESRWQALVQSLAPRTARGARFGRDLLQAGWDLLAFNTNDYAYRLARRSAPQPLATQAAATRMIAASVAPLPHAAERVAEEIAAQTTATQNIADSVHAEAHALRELAHDATPVVRAVRGLIENIEVSGRTEPLSSLPAERVSTLLTLARQGLDAARAAALAHDQNAWAVEAATDSWNPLRQVLWTGTGTRPLSFDGHSIDLIGWMEERRTPADAGLATVSLQVRVERGSLSLAREIDGLLRPSSSSAPPRVDEARWVQLDQHLETARRLLTRLEFLRTLLAPR